MTETRILILKTAALGDVLRTTSILPGLRERYPGCSITWVTAAAARDLVADNPHVATVEVVDPDDRVAVDELARRLRATTWDRVLSFDDEDAMCALASAVGGRALSGAYHDHSGARAYTDDTAAWFDMGLLSRDGKGAADRRKRENTRSHPEIFAGMLGVPVGRPQLPVSEAMVAAAAERVGAVALRARGPIVGLNTGAGGRWKTKELPVDRTVALAGLLHERTAGRVSFLLLGGPDEVERNVAIARGVAATPGAPHLVDTGTGNPILEFAALVSQCDVLVSSDSLGLHVATARRVPVVAFFAPTSAAEIHLYDRGEKVVSTAADYCSYRPDADNASITAERLADAVTRVLRTARADRHGDRGDRHGPT